MTKPFRNPEFFSVLIISFLLFLNAAATSGSLVKKNQRMPLVETEYGHISAVNISAGKSGQYHLEFFTLNPNSLFLPVLLHSDMVLYVHTGSGTLNFSSNEETKTINLRGGDIFRLESGSVFYMHSSSEQETEKLRMQSIFSNTDDELFDPSIGTYSTIADLFSGFNKRTLQSAFKVPEEVIEEFLSATTPPMIVSASPKKETDFMESGGRFLKNIINRYRGAFDDMNKKKGKKDKKEKKEKEKEKKEKEKEEKKEKEPKMLNIFEAEPDFKNCNGWSTTVDQNNLRVFMVNLTKGSMMVPHWNPSANEIAVVLRGQGMVRVLCSSRTSGSKCKNMRFMVKEGDVFAVPRFHPMAQVSFNNGSFVFMGFSATMTRNNPQLLAGKNSVMQALDRKVLGLSLNVKNTTLDQILSRQEDSIILDCTSCAEEEARIMQEEAQKEEEEEESGRQEKEEETQEREKEEEEEQREREKERREEREEEEEEERREREKERREEREAREREEERREREREEEPEIEERKRRHREEAATWEQETARRHEERQKRATEEDEPEATIKPYAKGFGYKDKF